MSLGGFSPHGYVSGQNNTSGTVGGGWGGDNCFFLWALVEGGVGCIMKNAPTFFFATPFFFFFYFFFPFFVMLCWGAKGDFRYFFIFFLSGVGCWVPEEVASFSPPFFWRMGWRNCF